MATTETAALDSSDECQLNTYIPVDLYDKVNIFCEVNGLKKKKFVEWALRKLLEDKRWNR